MKSRGKNNFLEISIKEKLSDGNSHTFNELFNDIKLKFPDMKIDKKKVSNTLYKMKKLIPELDMTEKGVYIMRSEKGIVTEKGKIHKRYMKKLKSCYLEMQRELAEEPFKRYENVEDLMEAKAVYEFLDGMMTLVEKEEERV